MRLIIVAGVPGSGKTSVIRGSCDGERFGFIANNERSSSEIEGIADWVDFYPMKSPCARIRQYSYRLELHSDTDVPVIISEPPGNCLEQSSPILNQVYATKRDVYEIGPLITVADAHTLTGPVSKRSTDGLRLYNMIDESDAIAVTFSEGLSDSGRTDVEENIRRINDECQIVFISDADGFDRMHALIFGDASYSRPLCL